MAKAIFTESNVYSQNRELEQTNTPADHHSMQIRQKQPLDGRLDQTEVSKGVEIIGCTCCELPAAQKQEETASVPLWVLCQFGLPRPSSHGLLMYYPISFPWPFPPYAAQPLSQGPLSIGWPNHPCHGVLAVFASLNPYATALCLYMLSNFSAIVLCPQGPSGLMDCLTTLCSSGLCPAPLLPAATTSESCHDALPPNATAFISQ